MAGREERRRHWGRADVAEARRIALRLSHETLRGFVDINDVDEQVDRLLEALGYEGED